MYRFNLRINKLTNKEAMMLLMFSITGFRAHFSKSKCARVLFINACSRDGVALRYACRTVVFTLIYGGPEAFAVFARGSRLT